ncbi:MAG TPA: hypothetical protein VGJ91_17475 [Polyangiaceae bacterium]
MSSTAHTIDQAADAVSEHGVEIANAACPALSKGDIASIELKGSPQVQAETKAFLLAVHNSLEYSTNVNRVVRARCSDIGVALGIPRKTLEKQETGPYGGAEEICTDTARAFARTGALVTLQYHAPACFVPLDAAEACLSSCGTTLTPAQLTASCKGGKLAGSCDGSCKGSCEGEVHAECAGACQGSCKGACSATFHGSCGGTCTGKCDGADAQGTCAGTCDGVCDAKCEGTCGGDCKGECSGTCATPGTSTCDGKCTGECSGKFEGLSCSGKFDPPKMDSTCQSTCMLQASAAISCGRPTVKAQVTGGDSAKIKAAIEQELPQVIQAVLEAGPRGIAQIDALVKTGKKLSSDLGDVGGNGVICVGAGITLATAASAKLTHSVKASIELKGMAGGKMGI